MQTMSIIPGYLFGLKTCIVIERVLRGKEMNYPTAELPEILLIKFKRRIECHFGFTKKIKMEI